MKAQRYRVIGFLVTLLLGACGTNQVQLDEKTVSDIYTSVAITLAAQTQETTPTPVVLPTDTPCPTFVVPTSQNPTATTAYVYYDSSTSCNNSAYVTDVTIEDGTEFAPGETFTKTWEFTNTGTCTWSSGYMMVFLSGKHMDGADTEIDQTVSPGETADVSVVLTAPEREGTYTGYWSMANASGVAFGQRVYVQIVVSDDVSTSTPTATATATAATSTSTSTPTATAAATDTTSTPTSTPTATATGTATTSTPTSTATATPTPTDTQPATATATATPTSTDTSHSDQRGNNHG